MVNDDGSIMRLEGLRQLGAYVDQHTPIHTMSTHPVNIPYQRTLSTHPNIHPTNPLFITANEKGLVLTSVQDIIAYRVEMENINISKE